MLTLQIPRGAKVLEMANSTVWFDESGILYSRPTNGDYVIQSRAEMQKEVDLMKHFIGQKKVSIIAEVHPKVEQVPKEDRDYVAQELESITQALAIITPNAVSRMVTNLFFLFKPAPFPTKMFVNVIDAKKWLLSDLKKNSKLPVL
jgi:hypothetical protein